MVHTTWSDVGSCDELLRSTLKFSMVRLDETLNAILRVAHDLTLEVLIIVEFRRHHVSFPFVLFAAVTA